MPISACRRRLRTPSGALASLVAKLERTNASFADELPRLLHEHGLSLREFARQIAVSSSYLSRSLRGVDYKRPGGDLAARAASALGLPEDYFPEFREAYVLERVRSDAELRDAIYAKLRGEKPFKLAWS